MLLHAKGCSCFDCKNNYTPLGQKASEMLRKYKKPTGKRPNRTKKINVVKEYKNNFTKQERKEWSEKVDFFNTI